MRKIKFRGKTLDGRWIYGDLWHRPYAKDCVTIVSFMEDTGTTGGLEVIPETVGQLADMSDQQLSAIRNLGVKSKQEAQEKLKAYLDRVGG